MHTSSIKRVSTDAKGRIVLTVSLDKTARLWSLEQGSASGGSDTAARATLLRVLRPPIGEGGEGILYCGTLSPDGSVAAVGGWTGYNWDLSHSVYLFDTASGRLMGRLSGLPNIVNDLAFSASGSRLAAGLGAGGIRVWELSSGRLLGQDMDYAAECYGVDWLGDETLATTCYDGEARLYTLDPPGSSGTPTRELGPRVRAVVPGGRAPFAIRFSPNGAQLAVGFNDSPKVAVLDGKTLAFQFAPSTSDMDSGDLGSIAWSADGRTLAAGGALGDATGSIRLWGEAGMGKPRDLVASQASIMDLRSLPDGSFLFGAGSPAWGLVPAGGSSIALGPSPIADHRNNREGFRLSADGTVVAFSYTSFGKSPHRFSVLEKTLTKGDEARAIAGLRSPRAEGLAFTEWQPTPKLNGQALKLQEGDIPRSLAIAPDASFFLLGSDVRLYCFSADGTERWQVPAEPGQVWAVNLSADGRLAVAAYSDGTIRWHRADTGRELLAFFPHADQKRWVLWTQDFVDIPQGRLGAALQEVNGHIEVEQISEASAAQAAGLRVGDRFISLVDKSFGTVPEWVEALKSHRPGTTIELKISRNGVPSTIPVTLGASPESRREIRGVYYETSAGAEDLIGWHVNRGKEQAADFFPAAKFRDAFYRPDIVAGVLKFLDVAVAVKGANDAAGRRAKEARVAEVVARMQPPIVELAVGGARSEVEVSGQTFPLRYRVRSATSEPVIRLQVLIDGRPVTMELPIPPDAKSEASATVPIPDRDCVLSLLAENRFAVSEPATVRVTRAVVTAPAVAEVPAELKPKLYLLAVGVNDYEQNDVLPDLNYAAKDATDFAAVFQKQEGGLYQKVEGRLLTDAGATSADVLDGLDWIKQETTAKDLAVVFFAGHGENDEELRYYYCPSDYDPKRRLRTGVAMEEIQKTLASIPGKVLFFIDTCHAGNALGKLFASRGGGVDINRLVNELSSAENGAIVFASSTGRQQSVESDEWQNGAFTKAIVEGLDGQADLLKNGHITVSSLETWVAERVKELSGGVQTPTVAKPQTVPDFPIAVKR